MSELKPCPFCGSDRIQFNVEGYFQPWEREGIKLWYRCSCHDCGCGTDFGSALDMNKATREWNRRADDGKE